MKKISILAILCLSTLVAYPAPSLLSVTGLAVLPHYSLVTVGTVPELKALSMTVLSTSTMGLVMGYYAPGDRGGGSFIWDPTSTAPDDGGSCINPAGNTGAGRWLRVLGGEPANVKMWGAAGNWNLVPAPMDDTKAIQAAFDACSSGAVVRSGELVFPTGFYLITDTVVFSSIIHVRGEGMMNVSQIIMSNSVPKDMFRTINASNILSGFDTGGFDDNMLIENISFFRKGPGINTGNACLAIGRPGEGHAIHNVFTDGGGYGIRCVGGPGGPGLRLRDCSLNDAWVAGLAIESGPAAGGGPVSLISISGDCRGPAITNSSLILISNSVCQVSIDSVKAEGSWGGGLIQYRWPDPASGYIAWGAMGSLQVANVNYYADGTMPVSLHDVIVLKGGQRTPSVSLHNFNLLNTRDLIRDEVAQRHVPSDANSQRNTAQMTLRLPVCYESYTNPITSNVSLSTRSRLVVGGSQIYTFTPATTGWYRVLTSVQTGTSHLGGNLVITTPAIESTEIEVDVSPYASANKYLINVVRSTANSTSVPPRVDRARVFNYFDSQSNGMQCFLDIRVAVAGTPITLAHDIHIKGDTDSGELPLLAPLAPVPDTLPVGSGSLDVSILR